MILKGNKKIETMIYMQIPAFEDLRKLVATRIDQGLGEEYAALVEANNDPKIKGDPWVSRVVNVEHYVEEHELDERLSDAKLMDFLFYPVERGQISYGTARRIYKLLKDTDDNIKLGEKVLLGDVKNLLLECGSKKSYMCWR